MIIEVLLSLLLVWLAWHVVTTFTKRRNMPPGPFPYPFLGNIPQIISADPVRPFQKLAKKYGDIYTVTLPNGNAVILNTAALVREARQAGKQENLMGKPPETIYPSHEILGEDLVTCDYSTVYRFRKRVFVSALHVFGAGIERVSVRAGYAVDMMVEEILSKPGQAFSPKELIEPAILVQLWEWITSNQVGMDDPIVKMLIEINVMIAKQALHSTIYQLFPFLKYLPTQLSRDIKRAEQIRNTLFPPEYDAHRKTYTPGIVRDLTDSFISAYEKELAKENGKDVASMEDIPGLMLDVAFAGSETTATSLNWLLLYVVLHSDVQRKIHEELDLVVGRDRLPRWTDSQNLPYLQATLCEVQRASGLIGLVGTSAIRDMTIAGYRVPKGTFVSPNLGKLHLDEREWSEPEKFKPERFLDEDGKFVGWNKLQGFLPFSVGRRECPGQSLAKIMMFTFASVLLHRFTFEVPEGVEKPSTKVWAPAAIASPRCYQIVAKPREGEVPDARI